MSLGERFFRFLMLAYPPAFRHRYGNDLVAFFRADRHQMKRSSTTQLLRFWFKTIGDLMRSVLAQWGEIITGLVRPTRRHPSHRRQPHARKVTSMETLLQDLRYAFRTFKRSPGFTMIALVTLALGIGTNAAVFSVVDGVLWEKLPYGDVDRVVSIWGTATDGNFGVSDNERLRYREQTTIFNAFGTYYQLSANISGPDGAERLPAVAMDEGVLPALQVSLPLGRGFREEETQLTSDRVVLLSDAMWRQRFEASPDVLGRILTVNGVDRAIVGVLPPKFRLPGNFTGAPAQLYIADRFAEPDSRNLHYMQAVANLEGGVSLTQARLHMETVGTRLKEELPSLPSSFVPAVVPVSEVVTGEIRPLLLILLGAVGLLLLIACVNVANLFLARSDSRSTELAVRAALGATRGRLIRQLLTESVVLALMGGAVGLVLAQLATGIIVRFDPPNIPRIDQLGIDVRVIGFTAVISLMTAAVFGLMPALASSGNRIRGDLHEGGRSGTGSARKHRMRRALVVVEVALALTLTAGAGLLARSFTLLLSTDSGLRPQGVLTLQTTLPFSRYSDADAARSFYTELLDQIRTMPGVMSAGAVTSLPLASDPGDWGIRIEGREEETLPGGRRPWADRIIVTDGYFEAMGIELVEGRTLSRVDVTGGREVVVINETAAKRYWPDESALGKRFILSTNIDSVYREVVGITQDVRHGGLAQETKPEMYLPHAQHPSTQQFPVGTMRIVARTGGEPLLLASNIRRAVLDIDPDVPVSDVQTMVDVVSASTSTEQLNVSLFSVFGVLALLLVSVGVYGVMSYLITQRAKELGIRMALGAEPFSVMKMVMRHGMTLALTGIGLGILGALALGRLLSNLLYGVTWYDPATFVATPLLVALVALIACTYPARRATRVDPIKVLRAE